MSPKLKRLSGKEVISILNKFGFSFFAQRGSHIKLRRIGSAGDKQTLTVPSHDELDVGSGKTWVGTFTLRLAVFQFSPLCEAGYL